MSKFVKTTTAVYRNGVIIPGGTPFGIAENEVENFQAKGFEVFEQETPEEIKAKQEAADKAKLAADKKAAAEKAKADKKAAAEKAASEKAVEG